MARRTASLALAPNTRGLLVTCNRGRENQALAEIRALDGLVSPEDSGLAADDLEAELAMLRKGKKSVEGVSLGSDVQCLVFARVADPHAWLDRAFSEVLQRRLFYPKYCQRVLPVEQTCQAHLNDLINCCRPLIEKHLSLAAPALTYAIVFERRLNSSLDRQLVTRSLAELVPRQHRVDLKDPDVVVLVEVLKSICAVSIIRDYYRRSRMNIQEFSNKQQ